jgi:hypothetical protein
MNFCNSTRRGGKFYRVAHGIEKDLWIGSHIVTREQQTLLQMATLHTRSAKVGRAVAAFPKWRSD